MRLERALCLVLLGAVAGSAFVVPPPSVGAFTSIPTSRTTVPYERPNHSRPSTIMMAAEDTSRVSPRDEKRIQLAKAFLDSEGGLTNPDLLADDFRFVGPYSQRLNKKDYLQSQQALGLKKAFPDLDVRAHDFRVDKNQANRVWYTQRVTGTHKGTITLDKETVIAPTGITMELPPESCSLVFNDDDKIVKAVGGGIVMDRTVGNSRGLAGTYGIAAALGRPVNPFQYYPPQKVIGDFFGRDPKFSKEKSPVFPPFPEAVMIGLARGMLASDFGASDPGLLAKDFMFVGPVVGPLKKDVFVKAFTSFNLRRALPDIKNEGYDFRLDPFDQSRVWFTVKSEGTFTGPFGSGKTVLPPTGQSYKGGPEAISVTFNNKGECTKLTVGVLMDPEEGNTGGLGGVYGVLYAVGSPLPPWTTRAFPEAIRNWQNFFIDLVSAPFSGLLEKPAKKPSAQPKPAPAPAAPAKPSTPPPAKKAPTAPVVAKAPAAASKPAAPKPATPAATPKISTPVPTKTVPAKTGPVPTSSAADKKSSSPPSFLDSLFGGKSSSPSEIKKPASPAVKPAPKSPALSPSSSAPAKPAAPQPPKPVVYNAASMLKPQAKSKAAAAPAPPAKSVTPTKPPTPAAGAKKPSTPTASPAKPAATGGFFGWGGSSQAPAKPSTTVPPLKASVPTKAKTTPAPAPTPAAKKPSPAFSFSSSPSASKGSSSSFSFPAKVEAELLQRLKNDKNKLNVVKTQTAQFVSGKIDDRSYWRFLTSTIGRDALDFIGLDLIRSLPEGEPRKQLFRLFQTS